MEVILVNTLNGVEHLVCIDDAASATGLQVEAISLFGFICRPADVRLAVDGIELEDDARLRDLAEVCEGCVIEATPTGTRYADAIHSGTLSLHTVPVWAQGLDECKIAAMEHRVVSEGRKTLEVVSKSGSSLKHAWPYLQRDKEIVMAAVTQNGAALQYASTELRGDREVVLKAVLKSGLAIEHASEALRADYGIALAAVRCTQNAFWKLPTSMRAKKNIRSAFMSR